MGIDLINITLTISISIICGLYSGIIVARRASFDQIKCDIISRLQTFHQEKINSYSVKMLFSILSDAENKLRYLGHFDAIHDIRNIQSEIEKQLNEDRGENISQKDVAIRAWNQMCTILEIGINIKPSKLVLYLPFKYIYFLKIYRRITNSKALKKYMSE